MQNPHYRRPSSPEYPPFNGELGDELSELLERIQGLATTTQMNAIDFVLAALDKAEADGIEIDDDISDMIVAKGFGTPEEVWDRISAIPPKEFVNQYPGPVGKMILNFVAPLFDQY